MGSGMVVVFNEGFDPRLQLTGQVGVFEQDVVLERLVSALDLALRLRMVWRTVEVGHAPAAEPVGQVTGDVARPVVGEQAWPLPHPPLIEPSCTQRQVKRGGDVSGLHRGAQLPGDDVAGEVATRSFGSSSTVDRSYQPQPKTFR